MYPVYQVYLYFGSTRVVALSHFMYQSVEGNRGRAKPTPRPSQQVSQRFTTAPA